MAELVVVRYKFEADLKMIDAASGDTVFHVWHDATNWDGLDEPFFYPMFNALVDWLHANKATHVKFVASKGSGSP